MCIHCLHILLPLGLLTCVLFFQGFDSIQAWISVLPQSFYVFAWRALADGEGSRCRRVCFVLVNLLSTLDTVGSRARSIRGQRLGRSFLA